MPQVWLGTEQALQSLAQHEMKFSLDKEAYARSPFDIEDNYRLDPDFGVEADRKGLTVLEKVGEHTVLKVHGSLTPSFRRYHAWFPGEVTSYEAIKDALAIIAENGTQKFYMDFNSGGGAVRGLDSVTAMMEGLQKKGVAIHGHTDSASFSASYWMMAGCDELTASRMAEVGSIGTMAVHMAMVNTAENRGVKFTVFKEGEFKGIGNPYEELGEKEKKYFQDNLRETNAFFLNHIVAKRGVDLDNTDAWAEGKTFYAAKAVKNGLIDRVTTLDDLIGSGASADTTGDKRKFEMKISAEKLAQITAGAAPESVLTAAELKQYNDHLAEEAAKQPEPTEEELAAKAEADRIALLAENGGDDPVETDKPQVAATKQLMDAVRANGRLEAKVEGLTAELEKVRGELESAQATANSLVVLGQAAVKNLQVATRSPVETKATATEVLGQYNDLSSKMAKMFKVGQQSEEAPLTDSTVAQATYDVREKAALLNQKKR